ncbi:hypothetical protein EDC94DRAFT_610150 [Helicostylum pulchrum]|nr:hypothetical protein EDC94DRAFT_610150 [Helicostylum pulchrum]
MKKKYLFISSLRNVKLQRELWDHISKKIREITNPNTKKEWEIIVDLFRKLREGIYATNWSHGDYTFAIKVFEHSVDSSIKARNFNELSKSLSGLINDLYIFKKDAQNPYYLLLHILYHCCFVQNTDKAMEILLKLDRNSNEGIFGKQLTKCVFVTENPIIFFRLYHNNPYPTFRAMMDNYTDRMRLKAIEVMRKAYLSASIEWVGIWLGVKNDNQMVVSIIEALVQPTCIKSVDNDFQLIHFLKKRK